tara:strand:- start:36 stop:245 length:210 start_codon:yes stop_codon:yes gene_type:complete
MFEGRAWIARPVNVAIPFSGITDTANDSANVFEFSAVVTCDIANVHMFEVSAVEYCEQLVPFPESVLCA